MIGEPDIAAIHPPDEHQHGKGVQQVHGTMSVLNEMSDLCDCENENEVKEKITMLTMMPTRQDVRESIMPMLRGTGIGSFFGALPGTGASIASFMAYAVEKKVAKDPSRFGQGAIEGITAPESANNVVTATALVPLLSLGIPGSNSAAILLGGFLIHGLQPGPMLFQKAPEVVYGLYGGLLIANIAMLLIGLVILSPCMWLVNRPKPYLIAFILALVMSGVFAIQQSLFDCALVLLIGVLGYAMRLLKIPVLPMVLGMVLGFMVESNYRRSLLISGGEHSIFVTDTASAILLGLSALLSAYSLWKEISERRKSAK